MLAVSTLLTTVIVFWLAASVVIALFGKNINHTYPSIALFVGGAAMIAAAFLGWQGDYVWNVPAPIYLSLAPFANRLDSLSSLFVGLLGIVTVAVALYSPGYLQGMEHKSNPACYWIELFMFIAGLLGVLLGANALSFLVSWEVMALSSLLLIATNLTSHESRNAAFIYLGATRIATALLMVGFLWMHSLTQSWDFVNWDFSTHATVVPALMIFLGCAIKAGLWPFQDWLPHAHPAAPAPVSALMSGVMIETALYAIIRILIMNGLVSPYIGYLMLTLGVISAFWGVLLAFLQQDLKVLLAYSSIENVGLIMIGIGMAVIGKSFGLPVVVALGLSGAIYHCLNHGFFKSLLFLGAGAIDSKTHTRSLEHYGGLGKKMPWTMVSFFIGSAAICSLPPLNGFNSKWLIYQSLFQLANTSPSFWMGAIMVICIGTMGLISGLTIATFTKAIGVAFLGRPRSPEAEHAVEVSMNMRVGQGILVLFCVVFGLAAPQVLQLIRPVCYAAKCGGVMPFPIPITIFATAITMLTAMIYLNALRSKKPETRKYITWECGFGELGGRMQMSSASFSENVAHTFAPMVEYHLHSTIAGQDRRHFPEVISTRVAMESLLESRFYGPAVRTIHWLGEHILLLQAGSVHLYLIYILVTLVALMLVGILT